MVLQDAARAGLQAARVGDEGTLQRDGLASRHAYSPRAAIPTTRRSRPARRTQEARHAAAWPGALLQFAVAGRRSHGGLSRMVRPAQRQARAADFCRCAIL